MSNIFLLVYATFLLCQSSLVHGWSTFVDPEGQFEVLLPDSVVTDQKTIATAIGELEFVSHAANEFVEDLEIRYALEFTDFPEGTFPEDSTDLKRIFLEEAVSNSLESTRGKLLYSEEVDNEEFPGQIWKIALPGGIHVKSKALLVRDRYYLLKITTPEKLTIKNKGDEFLDSFKLLRS